MPIHTLSTIIINCNNGAHVEELLTTPHFSQSVKLALADERKGGYAPSSTHFDQFALLGQKRDTVASRASAYNPDGAEPISKSNNKNGAAQTGSLVTT